ncbi:ArsR family transcriptional regulator [Puniceicoccaceae bacterium K14]|nr:ArsR family transcriptional regulator [Puniceicoccaceae bacterium K14]
MRSYEHPPLNSIELPQALHALSDPCRLKIVSTLLESNGQLMACNEFDLGVSKATASHHFDVLRNSGVTQTIVQGTKCMTSLRIEEFEDRFPGVLKLIANEVKD